MENKRNKPVDCKLTKKKAVEFAKALCGTAKGLELDLRDTGICQISVGHMRYDFWPLGGRINCQILVDSHCVSSYYFDFNTYEPDFIYTDDLNKKNREEDTSQDRLNFLYWLRDTKGINIPDKVIGMYYSEK